MADDRTPAPNDTAPKGGDKPAGTIDPNILSEDQLATFASACEASVNSDAFADLAAKTNTGLLFRGPAEFETFVRQNAEMNATILKEAGLVN